MANTPEPEHFYRAIGDIGLPDDVRRQVMTRAFALANEDAADAPVTHGWNTKRLEVNDIIERLAVEADVEGDSDLADLIQRFRDELVELMGR